MEGYLTDLPTKDGFSYMDFYLRKNNYLTYDGESWKNNYHLPMTIVQNKQDYLILPIDSWNSGNKTITWKDGSTSPYGERKTTIDEVLNPSI